MNIEEKSEKMKNENRKQFFTINVNEKKEKWKMRKHQKNYDCLCYKNFCFISLTISQAEF